MTKHIAIIPARGGSKRIKRKNVIDFMGKPMIAWTIDAALKTGVFQKIIASTDDEEIAEVSKDYGALVPFLREAYADDISPVSKATLDCLKNCEKIFSESYETVTQLMPNAPLRTHKDIIDHKDEFEAFQRESQISCFKFGWFNPWWAFSGSSDTKYEFIHKEKIKCRSQDLPTLFCPSGAIWMSKCDHLKKHHSFYSSSTKYKELEIMSAVDIDDLEDLDMARAFYLFRTQNNAT